MGNPEAILRDRLCLGTRRKPLACLGAASKQKSLALKCTLPSSFSLAACSSLSWRHEALGAYGCQPHFMAIWYGSLDCTVWVEKGGFGNLHEKSNMQGGQRQPSTLSFFENHGCTLLPPKNQRRRRPTQNVQATPSPLSRVSKTRQGLLGARKVPDHQLSQTTGSRETEMLPLCRRTPKCSKKNKSS